jgi:hypothetical protein
LADLAGDALGFGEGGDEVGGSFAIKGEEAHGDSSGAGVFRDDHGITSLPRDEGERSGRVEIGWQE